MVVLVGVDEEFVVFVVWDVVVCGECVDLFG